MVKFTEILNPSESKVISLNKWGAFNIGRGAMPFLLPWIILVDNECSTMQNTFTVTWYKKHLAGWQTMQWNLKKRGYIIAF